MPDRLSPQEVFSLVPRLYYTATILHVLSNRFLLVKKSLYCSSSTEANRGSLNKSIILELAVYLYCDVFMMQLKFYNYHVKRTESDWYCQLQGNGSQQFELR